MKPFELETYIFIFYFETKKLSINEKMVQNMVQKANPKVILLNKKLYKYTLNILHTFLLLLARVKETGLIVLIPLLCLIIASILFQGPLIPLADWVY